jgi:hypothetical protein
VRGGLENKLSLCLSSQAHSAERRRHEQEGGGGILSIITLQLWAQSLLSVEEIRALFHGLDIELPTSRHRREIQ